MEIKWFCGFGRLGRVFSAPTAPIYFVEPPRKATDESYPEEALHYLSSLEYSKMGSLSWDGAEKVLSYLDFL